MTRISPDAPGANPRTNPNLAAPRVVPGPFSPLCRDPYRWYDPSCRWRSGFLSALEPWKPFGTIHFWLGAIIVRKLNLLGLLLLLALPVTAAGSDKESDTTVVLEVENVRVEARHVAGRLVERYLATDGQHSGCDCIGLARLGPAPGERKRD